MGVIKQQQITKLQQRLSPQQILLTKLLEVPVEDLEQTIKEEIEKNPLLEEIPDTDCSEPQNEDFDNNDDDNFVASNDYTEDVSDFYSDDYDDLPPTKNYQHDDDNNWEENISVDETFQTQLIKQFNQKQLTKNQQIIGEELIGSIDESGYITRDFSEMSDDFLYYQGFEVSEKEIEDVLKIVQSLDPPGIAARNLKECLSLQLHRLSSDNQYLNAAISVIDICFDEFSKKHYDKICKRLNISEQQLSEALAIILKLNPKPGAEFVPTERNVSIIPDFIVSRSEQGLTFTLNTKNVPKVRFAETYYQSMSDEITQNKNMPNSQRKEAINFINTKKKSAEDFVDVIYQRHNTLTITMNEILNYQKDYFLTGDLNKLRPMLQKDIADRTGFDISTISRIVNGKYVATDFGTFLLKDLFSLSSNNDDGTEVTTKVLKQTLKDLIQTENKIQPLTDDEITKALQKKGFKLSRRTVAKYRESMNIPVARLRKELKNNE